MTTHSPDIVIIGGGVIGLSTAWELARRGARVTIVDAGRAGQASWAAAGMLAPLAETGTPGPLVDLGLDSLACYPTFLAALREETADSPELAGPGMLRVAVNEEQEAALCRALTWQRERGLPLEWLDGPTVRQLEPAIAPTVQAAVLSPCEQHVTPRRLLDALKQACRRQGVSLVTDMSVTGFIESQKRVVTVKTRSGGLSCGELLVAGGAWSREMGEWLGVPIPVAPVRGQVLALEPEPPTPLRHTIYGHSRYLVPRAGGQVVVGATEEPVGFDTRTTADGISSLVTAAATLVPALVSAPVESIWTGLRPVSTDGLPILGRLPGWQNVHVATGHGRNGILLTPITSEFMTQALLDNIPPPTAFDPARFTPTP